MNREGESQGESSKLWPLEFRAFQTWREELQGERVLVACSGGRDSVVLAACLARLSRRVGFELALAHVHHGHSSRAEVCEARDRAREFVLEFGRELGVKVYAPFASVAGEPTSDSEVGTGDSGDLRVSGNPVELKSEEELRDFRLRVLSSIMHEQEFTRVAFAHHAQDLLETRLIRMIRGTGAQGIVSMREKKDKVIRPILRESSEAIQAYAEQKNLEWIQDPTNAQVEPLRNWIRNEWLPQLELKRKGAGRALARSLESIAEACEASLAEPDHYACVISEEGIQRLRFIQLALHEKRQVLASYLLAREVNSFSSSQIDEILKRLKTEQKSFTFDVAGLRWQITKELIRAQRL